MVLFNSFFAALTYLHSAATLALSGFDPVMKVYGKCGQILAFDTKKSKVFAGGKVRDISEIRTVQWMRQGKVVYVEINFTRGRNSMFRIVVSGDGQGADIVNNVCDIAGLTLN